MFQAKGRKLAQPGLISTSGPTAGEKRSGIGKGWGDLVGLPPPVLWGTLVAALSYLDLDRGNNLKYFPKQVLAQL